MFKSFPDLLVFRCLDLLKNSSLHSRLRELDFDVLIKSTVYCSFDLNIPGICAVFKENEN